MRELERKPPSPLPPATLPPVLVIGHGRLGRAIGTAAGELGLAVEVADRNWRERLPLDRPVLLCVPDAEIETACAELVGSGARPPLLGHGSGARGLDALAGAASVGVETFCLHPLQTIPGAGASLSGAPAAIAGSTPAALDFARHLATALGMRPFELAAEARAAYHAAASIASNFLVALEESAVSLLAAAGVEEGRELLAPLVLRTAANWAEAGPGALTGPIARGDTETVGRHLEALREIAPELVPLYEVLAAQTRTIASESAS